MHLGAVSTVIVSLPLKDAARRMRQFGLKSIEIGTGGFLPKNDCDPAKLLGDESALAEFKGTLAEPDLKISACAMHGEPLRPDPAISQAYRRDFPDTCALAQKRGRRETMPGHAPGATPLCQLPRAHSISLRGVLLGPGPITWVGWEPRWVLP